ncbi:MobA/MobL family protein [Acinetobacter sp. B10A]|uniref:MobQ family relaxase n=1 Tax=Acinetobacter baretiae TaxID=2605383 RepID=UPI001B3C74C3|nr:MobQ family relaxase [Acinetobacter baretiae]MBF7686469.1 MobA/MobL family protein [Acinetobacter baretiae]
MAIYHFSVKAIRRSDGRSAVACAAYRAGKKLIDNKYGKVQDYTKKRGVEFEKIYAPENTNPALLDRNDLWNAVEKRENRKDATLAREFEIAFPAELNQEQRKKMLDDLCNQMIEKHNVIVDAAIHAPHTSNGSDERNYHAHIMFTSRSVDLETGLFSDKKYRDFNKEKGSQTINEWRADFAKLTNDHLQKAGFDDIQVDHRSYAAQNIEKQATQHEGPAVTAKRRQYEREHKKPVNERKSEIMLPDVAKKNDAIKAFNLNLEIRATEQLLSKMKSEANKKAFERIINNAKQQKVDNKTDIFDKLNAGIAKFKKESLFSQLNSNIEEQANAAKKEQEMIGSQSVKHESVANEVEARPKPEPKQAEQQQQHSKDHSQSFDC